MIQKKAEFLPNELDHPCKQTCSGWRQGYERGHQRFVNEDDSMWKAKYIAERDRASKEIAELEAALSMQGVDYGAAKEQMEKNYISAVSGRKEFRSLAVELRDQVSSLQSQLSEATRERARIEAYKEIEKEFNYWAEVANDDRRYAFEEAYRIAAGHCKSKAANLARDDRQSPEGSQEVKT